MGKTGLRLFRLFGIDVYLHWAWIIVAVFEIQGGRPYSSLAWNIVEYLSLFAIVLMHEFGHALACRSVGGTANRIVLWPLGGVAFISPPQRPGAVLWSIVAGPLVNVVLVPVTFALWTAARHGGASSDVVNYVQAVMFINIALLVFNLMPAYPLDGGQILRALLWFLVGPVTSLRVACVIGFVGAAAVGLLGLRLGSIYIAAMAAFMAFQSWVGWQRAKLLAQAAGGPSYAGFACPSCGAPPPAGPFWRCSCGNSFDTFAHNATCPRCGRTFTETRCPRCGRASPRALWQPQWTAAPGAPPTGAPVSPPAGGQPPVYWGPPPPPPPFPASPRPLAEAESAGDGGALTIPPAEAMPEPGAVPPRE